MIAFTNDICIRRFVFYSFFKSVFNVFCRTRIFGTKGQLECIGGFLYIYEKSFLIIHFNFLETKIELQIFGEENKV